MARTSTVFPMCVQETWRNVMIDQERVRRMTASALLQKQGERRYADICRYRRRDYISLQLFFTWLCVTAAYLLMTGVLLMYLFGKNPDRYIDLTDIGQIALLWGAVYLLCCLACGWISWLCSSARWMKAARWKRLYRSALRALEDCYAQEECSQKAGTGKKG